MLKAIETQYKGYRFRSRLEARWAVFFDALGITWEYEKEGYDLGAIGWYLPDFQIFNDLWIEIKGKSPTQREINVACALAVAGNGAVILVSGTPGEETAIRCLPKGNTIAVPHSILESYWCSLFNLCAPNCGARSICRPYFAAIQAARSARFEHGETPAPQPVKPKPSEIIEPLAIIRPRAKAPSNRLSYLLDYVVANIERWQFVHEGVIYALTVDQATRQRILDTLTNGLAKIDKGQIEVGVSLPAIFANGKPHHIFVNINRHALEHLNASSIDFAPIVRFQTPKGRV